jgi:glyoxylase-like metal-dependent hydrolase (beta-lactamase superfamily II)
MKITENIYVVPGVTANTYILADPDGLTMIDTGLPYSEKRILEYVASLGRTGQDIRRILITHADLDHYGCLAALQKASGACTYASRREAESMAKGRSSRPVGRSIDTALKRFLFAMMSRLMRATPIQVDEILAEGQVLPVLGGLQVVETPGHSPGHLSYFLPSAGILFCGDSMRSDGKRGFRASRSRNDWDPALASVSVRKQAGLRAKIVCPGHGPVVREAGSKFPNSPDRHLADS